MQFSDLSLSGGKEVVASFLSTEDLLNLREVNKESCEMVKTVVQQDFKTRRGETEPRRKLADFNAALLSRRSLGKILRDESYRGFLDGFDNSAKIVKFLVLTPVLAAISYPTLATVDFLIDENNGSFFYPSSARDIFAMTSAVSVLMISVTPIFCAMAKVSEVVDPVTKRVGENIVVRNLVDAAAGVTYLVNSALQHLIGSLFNSEA